MCVKLYHLTPSWKASVSAQIHIFIFSICLCVKFYLLKCGRLTYS